MQNPAKEVEFILHSLNEVGFPAYLVGGSVRDHLMGRPLHDYDVTTAAHPDEVKSTFSDSRILDTGLQHGTVTLLTELGPIEITTFRTEGAYTDHRRPDCVAFTTNLNDDLARRDFTMNAIAFGLDGLHDPYGGQTDIQNRIIRCVGNPTERFEEDALRILRALRFASALDFSIDEKTSTAIHQCAPLLRHISIERVASELCKLLCGDAVTRVLLDYPDVITTIIPELSPTIGFQQHTPYHSFDIYTHIAHTVSAVPADETLRLAALLHDIAKPQTFHIDDAGIGHFYRHATIGAPIAEDILRRLRLSNATIEAVVPLVAMHGFTRDTPMPKLPRLIAKLGEEGFFNLLALDRADDYAKHLAPTRNNWDEIALAARNFLDTTPCLSIKDLAVNGNDALSAGLVGKEIGTILNHLLQEVLDGTLDNNRETLLPLLVKGEDTAQ